MLLVRVCPARVLALVDGLTRHKNIEAVKSCAVLRCAGVVPLTGEDGKPLSRGSMDDASLVFSL
jgi:hypothetical protein